MQGAEIERLGRAARPEVLAEIARVTRGQVIEPARLELVLQSLAALPEPPPDVRRLQLWSHPVTIILMVTLLGVFWVAFFLVVSLAPKTKYRYMLPLNVLSSALGAGGIVEWSRH